MAKKKSTEIEEAKTEAAEKTEAAAEADAKPKLETKAVEKFTEKCIYVGPTIAKYALTENAIYKAGAAYPSEAVKKIPALKKLIVPVKDFSPALPGNLRAYYNRAARSAKEL